MTQLSSFNQFGSKICSFPSLLLDFTEIRPVLASLTLKLLKIYIYLINLAQTSLVGDCAGGTQGVQLLDRSH